ncbi:MAG: V-type ATPase subunit, partial [Oscillospiraceae bacterium]
DPQLSDLVLDRAMFAQMVSISQASESEYLQGYVRLMIDCANLRVVVRAARAGKGFDYLRRAVLAGGTVAPDRLTGEATADSVQSAFTGKYLAAASSAAAQALTDGGLAALDLACDNALIQYIRAARLIAFGEAHIISYLTAREAELVSVRTVMAGRAAGLREDQIMERLRVSYV